MFGALGVGMMLMILNIAFHVAMLIICSGQKHMRTINFLDFLPETGAMAMNVIRYVILASAAAILLHDVLSYRFINHKILTINILLYISLTLSAFIAVIWISVLFTGKYQSKNREVLENAY